MDFTPCRKAILPKCKHGNLRREWYFRAILTFVAANVSNLSHQYLECFCELITSVINVWRVAANELQISILVVLLLYIKFCAKKLCVIINYV